MYELCSMSTCCFSHSIFIDMHVYVGASVCMSEALFPFHPPPNTYLK